MVKGSNAEKGGLKDEDHILEVDGNSAKFIHDFKKVLLSKKGQTTAMKIERNGTDTLVLQIPVDLSLIHISEPTRPY